MCAFGYWPKKGSSAGSAATCEVCPTGPGSQAPNSMKELSLSSATGDKPDKHCSSTCKEGKRDGCICVKSGEPKTKTICDATTGSDNACKLSDGTCTAAAA
jgi:hypothetical protein